MNTTTLAANSLQVQANRHDLVSRLADDLAHAIKNPLHAMVINLELLRRRVQAGESEQALERTALIEQEIARIHQLVEPLLQLLRPVRNAGGPINVDQALADLLPILQAYARTGRVEFQYEPAGDAAVVAVPKDALRHVVLNLCVNAIEAAAADGGRLELRGECSASDVRLRIRDNGPGVPREIAAQLGAPGGTTRAGRAGLGLAVARTLLEEAGGRLELEQGAGTGTTFLAILPRARHACPRRREP